MIKELLELIPDGERLKRVYRAFEGDFRIVTVDKTGTERRYTVILIGDHAVRLERT